MRVHILFDDNVFVNMEVPERIIVRDSYDGEAVFDVRGTAVRPLIGKVRHYIQDQFELYGMTGLPDAFMSV